MKREINYWMFGLVNIVISSRTFLPLSIYLQHSQQLVGLARPLLLYFCRAGTESFPLWRPFWIKDKTLLTGDGGHSTRLPVYCKYFSNIFLGKMIRTKVVTNSVDVGCVLFAEQKSVSRSPESKIPVRSRWELWQEDCERFEMKERIPSQMRRMSRKSSDAMNSRIGVS